jgi:hypothetical protein
MRRFVFAETKAQLSHCNEPVLVVMVQRNVIGVEPTHEAAVTAKTPDASVRNAVLTARDAFDSRLASAGRMGRGAPSSSVEARYVGEKFPGSTTSTALATGVTFSFSTGAKVSVGVSGFADSSVGAAPLLGNVSVGAAPLLGNVPVGPAVVETSVLFSDKVVGEPDSSELEPPHDANKTAASTRPATRTVLELIFLLHTSR